MSEGEKKAKTADERSLDIKCYIKNWREAGEGRVGGGGGGTELCNHSKRNQTTKPVTESSPQQPSVSRGAETQAGKDKESEGKNEEQTYGLALSLSQGQYHISESN